MLDNTPPKKVKISYLSERLQKKAAFDCDLFKKVGLALYGGGWMKSFARKIGAKDQTVARWSKGVNTIGIEKAEQILAIADKRILEIQAAKKIIQDEIERMKKEEKLLKVESEG